MLIESLAQQYYEQVPEWVPENLKFSHMLYSSSFLACFFFLGYSTFKHFQTTCAQGIDSPKATG